MPRTIRALTVLLAALAASCGPVGGGLSRPGSERRIDCPTKGFDYTVRFTPGAARSPSDSLYVTFTGRRPTSEEAQAVLQNCINVTARTIRVDYDMLVTAWFNQEGPLPLPDGSANLTYDPKSGATKTWSHRAAALAKPEVARPGVTVQTTTHKTPVPPHATLVTLDVIFEKPPGQPDIMKTLVTEITKAVGAQKPKVNTMAYPRSGPPGEQKARPQIRGASGGFLSAHFNAKTGEIRDQDGRVIGSIK